MHERQNTHHGLIQNKSSLYVLGHFPDVPFQSSFFPKPSAGKPVGVFALPVHPQIVGAPTFGLVPRLKYHMRMFLLTEKTDARVIIDIEIILSTWV